LVSSVEGGAGCVSDCGDGSTEIWDIRPLFESEVDCEIGGLRVEGSDKSLRVCFVGRLKFVCVRIFV
jgi:hypothetical protein